MTYKQIFSEIGLKDFMRNFSCKFSYILILFLVSLLAACGGGSSTTPSNVPTEELGQANNASGVTADGIGGADVCGLNDITKQPETSLGNPYPCCPQNPKFANLKDAGNCTWYAWKSAQDAWGVNMPVFFNPESGHSHAKDWVKGLNHLKSANAIKYAQYKISAEPRVNSIGVSSSGDYGHVAWITDVTDYATKGLISVKEQGCLGNDYGFPTREKTRKATYFDLGYIYYDSNQLPEASCTDTKGTANSGNSQSYIGLCPSGQSGNITYSRVCQTNGKFTAALEKSNTCTSLINSCIDIDNTSTIIGGVKSYNSACSNGQNGIINYSKTCLATGSFSTIQQTSNTCIVTPSSCSDGRGSSLLGETQSYTDSCPVGQSGLITYTRTCLQSGQFSLTTKTSNTCQNVNTSCIDAFGASAVGQYNSYTKTCPSGQVGSMGYERTCLASGTFSSPWQTFNSCQQSIVYPNLNGGTYSPSSLLYQNGDQKVAIDFTGTGLTNIDKIIMVRNAGVCSALSYTWIKNGVNWYSGNANVTNQVGRNQVTYDTKLQLFPYLVGNGTPKGACTWDFYASAGGYQGNGQSLVITVR
jgi:surface antigen